ncbi:hypothetical protein G9A89_004651 [Geosiphon pyriformis]|nr:hypothetical protein G9A89_004651 [Geosiphon pyriformis]
MTFLSKPKKQHQSTPVYPWSQKRLSISNPFPRYGHSASQNAHKNEIFIFGGIAKGKARNEVFVMEANTLNVLAFVTSGTIPSPRSLHTHVNIGDNMIVWGGIPQNHEEKPDQNLYILNTVSKVWRKPKVHGDIPIGRSGHSATVLGTTMFVFGGQTDDYYLNDLVTFDITTLNSPTPRWKTEVPTNQPPNGRAGHIACAYNDKIYVFGGADGERYYNDTWCYDIRNKTWSELACIGYIPIPRAGHGATLVDDVVYVFGGRGQNGEDLYDLAAFRISNHRWYMFQKMGPSPSPRFGLAMAAAREKIFVLGGDSSQLPKPDEEFSIHVLDTLKIKYPNDSSKGPSTQSKQQLKNNGYSLSSERSLESSRPSPSPSPSAANFQFSNVRSPSLENSRGVNQPPGSLPKGISPNNMQVTYEDDAFYQRPIMSPSRPDASFYDGRSSNSEARGPPSSRALNGPESQVQQPPRQGSPRIIGQDSQLMQRQGSPHSRGPEPAASQGSPKLPTENDGNLTPSPRMAHQEISRSPGPNKRQLTGSSPVSRSPSDMEVNGVPLRSPPINNGNRTGPEQGRYLEGGTGNNKGNYPDNRFIDKELSSTPPPYGQSSNFEFSDSRHVHQQRSMDSFGEIIGVGGGAEKRPRIMSPEKTPTLVSASPALYQSDFQNPRQAPRPPTSSNSSTGRSGDLLFGVSPNPSAQSPLAITTAQLPLHSMLYGGGPTSPSEESINTIRSPILTSFDDMNLADQFPAPVSNQERDNLLNELAQRDTNIAQLKRRENWLRIELALARKAGYTPETDRDRIIPEGIDIEQLMDLGENESEKYKVLQAVVRVKQELKKAKASIANQAQAASQKIAESERARTAALQEAAYFKAKLTALTNASEIELASIEVERARELEKRLTKTLMEKESLEGKLIQYQQSSNYEKTSRESAEEREKSATARAEEAEEAHAVALADLATLHSRATLAETQLRDLNTKLAEANSELSTYRSETSSSRNQVINLQQSLEQHQRGLEKANNALIAANERSKETENLWREARQEIMALEKEAAGLRAELDVKMRDLERGRARAEETERLFKKSQKEVDAVREMMQESMTELLNTSRSTGHGFNDDASENITKISRLQEELASLKALQIETQANANDASDSLAEAMTKISQMEATSMKARSEVTVLQRKLAETLDEVARSKDQIREKEQELHKKSRALEDAEVKVGMMRDVMSEKGMLDDGAGGKGMALRYKELVFRFTELEKEYNRLLLKAKEDQEKVKILEEIDRSSSSSSIRAPDTNIEGEDQRNSFAGVDSDRKLNETRDRLKQVEADYQTAVHYVKGTEKMLRRMKEELTRTKKENVKINEKLTTIQEKNEELEEKLAETEANMSVRKGVRESKVQEYATARLEEQRNDFIREKEGFQQQINELQAQLERATDEKNMMDAEYKVLRKEYETLRKEHDKLKKSDAQLREQAENSESHVVRLNEALAAAQTELEDALAMNTDLKKELESVIRRKNGSTGTNSGEDMGQYENELQQWEDHRARLEREISESQSCKLKLEKENADLEQKWKDAENKITILLDQMEHAVDTYRGIEDEMRDSSPRSSGALDSLNNEFDMLKSRWDPKYQDTDPPQSPSSDDYIDSRWNRISEDFNERHLPSRIEEYDEMMAALDEVQKVAAARKLGHLGPSTNLGSSLPSVSTTPSSPMIGYHQHSAAQAAITPANATKTPNPIYHGPSVIDQIRETLNLTPPPSPPVVSP